MKDIDYLKPIPEPEVEDGTAALLGSGLPGERKE